MKKVDVRLHSAQLAKARVQTNSFGHALTIQIMKGFYMYNHWVWSKKSPLGTWLEWFFKKTENIDFTLIFSIWQITKIGFVKNLENKKFQNISHIDSWSFRPHFEPKKIRKKILKKIFIFDFDPYFGISHDFSTIFSVF